MTHNAQHIFSTEKFRACLAAGMMAACGFASWDAASAPIERYTYEVSEPRFGVIGTYSNTVEKSDDETTIGTEAHIRVSFLGFTLYSQEVSRTERLEGGRLVYFHGVTTENGKLFEVDGRAEGNHFVVTTPNGKVEAPEDVLTANPWSVGTPGRDALLMPDSGVVKKAVITEDNEASLKVDGVATPVRHWQIDTGDEKYNVWMDGDGVPVKFTIHDPDSDATLKLTSVDDVATHPLQESPASP